MACRAAALAAGLCALFPVGTAHTWMFSRGRATMEASLDRPFRVRKEQAGLGTHAQVGPGQEIIVRWASAHDYTYTFAVVAATDQAIFYDPDFYTYVADYVAQATPAMNKAAEKPRTHGVANYPKSWYIPDDADPLTACADGACVTNLFSKQLDTSHPTFVDHFDDMAGASNLKYHTQYEYAPEKIAGDRRIAYDSDDYPWLVAVYQYENKVNMHAEWDLISMDFPAKVFTEEAIASKGQHYMVHYSSTQRTDYGYADVIDVHVHPTPVAEDLKYGNSSDHYAWIKVDHCQFIDPESNLSPVRDATNSTAQCAEDMERFSEYNKPLGINVVPAVNPDVVPSSVSREVEQVNPICTSTCTHDAGVQTVGYCRQASGADGIALCAVPSKLHTVAWANPQVSSVVYDANTVADARAGEYIEWRWDQKTATASGHDVWLMASPEAAAACDFTGGTELVPQSQVSPDADDQLTAGNNDKHRYRIPEAAAGQVLHFACSVGPHCGAGQVLAVAVGTLATEPDPDSDQGVCEEDYQLCEDQSQQTETSAKFETEVNIPFSDLRTASSLRMYGEATRASTPWEDWGRREISDTVCQLRAESSRKGSVDYGRPLWDLPNTTLREALEACSSSHPEICNGISWHSAVTTVVNVPESDRQYSSNAYHSGYPAFYLMSGLDSGRGWEPGYEDQKGGLHQNGWMQLDLGSVKQVHGVVTQDNEPGDKAVTAYEASYSTDNETFTVIDTMLFGPQGTAFEMPCALPDSTAQVPCTTTPNAEQLIIKTTGGVGGPYGGIGQHIYMWSVTMEPTVAIATKCAGCLLEFSNGNGGSFISTGIHEWSRDDGDHNTMYFYLQEDVTGADVNAVISIGDTLTVRSITDDSTGNMGRTALHAHVRADFQSPVAARYVRLRPLAFYSANSNWGMRAGLVVGKSAGSNNMFVGRHHFRRCIVTDGYTRLVRVGPSSTRSKSVSCPGCYTCREMPDHAGWGWGPYSTTKEGERGFDLTLSTPGDAGATLTATLPHPVSLTLSPMKTSPTFWTWEHELEVLCRVDPAYGGGPLAPALDTDTDWTTFMQPTATGSPLEAIKDGFAPPAMAAALRGTSKDNLAAVYRPGDQIDPDGVGPFANPDFHDLRPQFEPPTPVQSGGGSDDVWWPPKPAFKVSFQPRFTDPWTSAETVAAFATETETDGWHIDHGDDFGAQTNSVTGSTAEYGWRCAAAMSWHGTGYLPPSNSVVNSDGVRVPAHSKPGHSWGVVKYVGTHRSSTTYDSVHTAVSVPHCPDGLPNVWEAAVPNGLYTVTVEHAMDNNNPSFDGCNYENIRPVSQAARGQRPQQTVYDGGDQEALTVVFSAEVMDGRFTLSNVFGLCENVGSIKLDLVTLTPHPAPWLPPPDKEWWQMELSDSTAPVGLVEIMLPHERDAKTFESFPNNEEGHAADCRGWWLYAPARCYHMMVLGEKPGIHPDLALYPNFPGFSTPFLEWLFDTHDLNNDGSLTQAEFTSVGSAPPYGVDVVTMAGSSLRPDSHRVTDLNNFFQSVLRDTPGATEISRDLFVNSHLAQPRPDFCDDYEALKDGGRGVCAKFGNAMPQLWSNFTDDGQHGYVVMLSDVPCTDAAGCPAIDSDDVTICSVEGASKVQLGIRYDPTSNTGTQSVAKSGRAAATPPVVDCKGATGRYLQIWLPGQGRLFPADEVRVHRAWLPGPREAPSRTAPKKQMACYGVQARQVPSADDPNVLASTKQHPYLVEPNNPEDPIFHSTCFVRAIVREWLPLRNEVAPELGPPPWSFGNKTHCLDCACHAATAGPENGADYNMTTMKTPQWWLQPEGRCQACDDSHGSCAAVCNDDGTPRQRMRGYRVYTPAE